MFEFQDYTAMRQKIGELFEEEKLAEAAEILEWGLKEFPDNLMANAYNLATGYTFLNQPEKAADTLMYGLDNGIWYGVFDFSADFWEPVKELDKFQEIQARSQDALQAVQETAKPELAVFTPTDYDPTKKYPLFIALHGGGGTIENFKPQWTSPKMENDFIVAYPQSSRVVSMTGFCWMCEALDRQEILAAYQSVLADYAIDTDNIIMGGFSAGGEQTFTFLLEEQPAIPIRGFVTLCPPIPKGYPQAALSRILERGQRGMLLTSEIDGQIENQRKFAAALEDAGIPLKFVANPNTGHWFPPDLSEKIDEAINFILN